MTRSTQKKWPETNYPGVCAPLYPFQPLRLLVRLVTALSVSIALSLSSSAFASQEQLNSLIAKEQQLSQELDKTKADIRSLERRLQSTNANSVKLLKTLRNKRAVLQDKHRSMRLDGQNKRRELSDLHNEKVGAETRLKLVSSGSDAAKITADLNQIIGKIKLAETLLVEIKQDLLETDRKIDSLSPQSNATYETLTTDQTQLEEDLSDARQSTVELRRQLRSVAGQRSQVEAQLQAQRERVRSLPEVRKLPVQAISKVEPTSSQKIVTASIPGGGDVRRPLVTDYPSGTDLAALDDLVKVDNTQAVPSAFVFLISGEEQTNIDDTLKLQDWVEGFGAKFIPVSWNNVLNRPGEFDSQTTAVQQMRRVLTNIPANSNLILIGHGLGGGTAIRVATEAAYDINRRVDYLAVMDPSGVGQLRANIVKQTNQRPCLAPGDAQGTIAAYLDCVKRHNPRPITGNVLNFYNRWQKEVAGPLDYKRSLRSANGLLAFSDSSTGRFVAPPTTRSDQKRMFYNNKKADTMILTEASDVLPNLLIEYLR